MGHDDDVNVNAKMPGLTDDEVLNEMKKMTAFIRQEALEKAREIKVKADEEFAIEKAKIVRQETSNIDANHESKQKALEIEKKIAQSTLNNKARLKQLERREHLLENLTLQALFTMMEKDVSVVCRAADKDVVDKAVKDAAKAFEDQAGFPVKCEVVPELPKESAGGVIVKGYGGRIVVNNSLDERLRLLEERMLPEIRESLFGKNPNRRFYT